MLSYLKIMKLMHYVNNPFLIENVVNNIRRDVYNNLLRMISFTPNCRTNLDVNEEKKKKRMKTVRIPEIKLLHVDGTVTTTVLDNAQKIAKRRNLQLIEVPSNEDKPTYKLVDVYNETEEVIKKGKGSKHKAHKKFKIFYLQSNIVEHDIWIKIKNINKVLSKQQTVKVIFMWNEEKKELLNKCKEKIQGKLVEEIIKSTEIAFIYAPLKNDTSYNVRECTL